MDLSQFMRLTPIRRADRGPQATAASPGDRAAQTREPSSPPWQGDPTIAALLKLVSAPHAEADGADGAALDDVFDDAAAGWTADEVDELTDRLDDSVREARRLCAELVRAEAELRQLRARSRRLADALGACSACWGEDSGCPECQGCGRPGRSLPDDRLFAEVVMPAVRLVRLSDRGTGQPRIESAPTGLPRDKVVVNLYANALLERGARHR